MLIINGRIHDRRGEPQPELSVELWDEGRRRPEPLARSQQPSDGVGGFMIEVDDAAMERTRGRQPRGNRPSRRRAPTRLRLRVFQADGQEWFVEDDTLAWEPGVQQLDAALVVKPPGNNEVSLAGLSDEAGLAALPDLLALLSARGFNTLADVRASGGIAQLGEERPDDADTLNAIASHARLAAVAPSVEVSRRLVASGMASVGALARSDPQELMAAGLDPSEAVDLRNRAAAYRAALASFHIEAEAATANLSSRLYRSGDQPIGLLALATPEIDPDACATCDLCDSALSPLAYLSDLLDFLIDNFTAPHSTSASVQPRSFPDLAAIETRFRRSFGALPVTCAAVEESIRQIEIAIEVLERFITTPPVSGYSREFIYGMFDLTSVSGRPLFPYPAILSQTFDAYLEELGITRRDFDAAVQAAYPAPPAAPDQTLLDAMLPRLGVTAAELQSGLNLAAGWNPTIRAIDWMPELVRQAKARGLNPGDPQQLAAYRDSLAQTEAAVGRVKTYALPAVRANLIAIALREVQRAGIPAELAALTSARQLGNYLHTDLEADACMTTTRAANAMESLQSFVDAFRTGREDPGYYLSFRGGTPEGNFDARWRWLSSYGTWQAAQTVFLYPENFLMPDVRHDISAEFDQLLRSLGTAGGSATAVDQAVATYRAAVLQLSIILGRSFESHPVGASGIGLAAFRDRQQQEHAGLAADHPLRRYLDEWYFYLPLAVADAYSRARVFERAAEWLHVVFYPYAANFPPDFPFPPARLVWYGFGETTTGDDAYRNTVEWLSDPFRPFAIARTRQGAMLRHVIFRYVENLLGWADDEFSRDTAESTARARELYELAEDLLQIDEVPSEDACRIAWRSLHSELFILLSAEELRQARLLLDPLVRDARVRRSDITAFGVALREGQSFATRLNALKQLTDQVSARPLATRTLADVFQARDAGLREITLEDALNRHLGDASLTAIWRGADLAPEVGLLSNAYERLVAGFCAPPNPLVAILRDRAAVNLEKIRTCRNIAGMRSATAAYAPSADPLSIVRATAGGTPLEDAIPSEPTPVFRFSYLVERARDYVTVAQQLESLLLNAYVQGEEARFSLMKARQDLRVAQDSLALQALRVQEAANGLYLAQLQRGRAAFQRNHYEGLVNDDLSRYEEQAIGALWAAHDWAIAATVVGGVGEIGGAVVGGIIGAVFGNAPGGTAGAVAGAVAAGIASGGRLFQGISQANSLYSQARSLQATYERRRQDWEYQRDLAGRDAKIGEQGVTLASDRQAIVERERAIARTQAEFAGEVVDFLGARFLNAQLWEWMGQLLRRIYREHLTMATTIARMAQRSLEFERQESLAIIGMRYAEHERRDLLAAERLLTDINRLEQHRLLTEQLPCPRWGTKMDENGVGLASIEYGR
jgi:hypothetical protein